MFQVISKLMLKQTMLTLEAWYSSGLTRDFTCPSYDGCSLFLVSVTLYRHKYWWELFICEQKRVDGLGCLKGGYGSNVTVDLEEKVWAGGVPSSKPAIAS